MKPNFMKKDAYYFSHDYNARNDKKLVKLKQKYRMTGVGIFWSLVEMMYEEGGQLSVNDIPIIASELRSREDIVREVVDGFDLFKCDGNSFWSESVKRRLDKRLEKSEKAKASASHRWQNANGMRTHSDRYAKKGKERKGNKKKINKENVPPSAESVRTFYDDQLALCKSEEFCGNYKKMVDYLYGQNPKKQPYENILSMKEQATYHQFLSMKEKSEATGVTIKEILDAMENRAGLSKTNISLSGTAMNWMRRNQKEK